jgi:hypothetical protein
MDAAAASLDRAAFRALGTRADAQKADAWTQSRVGKSFETAFSRPILALEERDGEFC